MLTIEGLVLGYGGEIRFLPIQEGHSTSGLIERIAACAGATCRT